MSQTENKVGKPLIPAQEKQEPKEKFLSRWARLKREAQRPAESGSKQAAAKPLPELPPLESLTLESDFSVFMHPQVDEGLRRAALRKLFSHPHFSEWDGLDIHMEDYNRFEPLEPGLASRLAHAANLLGARAGAEGETEASALEVAPEPEAPKNAQPALGQRSEPGGEKEGQPVPLSSPKETNCLASREEEKR